MERRASDFYELLHAPKIMYDCGKSIEILAGIIHASAKKENFPALLYVLIASRQFLGEEQIETEPMICEVMIICHLLMKVFISTHNDVR
jgi:hypothetical protein